LIILSLYTSETLLSKLPGAKAPVADNFELLVCSILPKLYGKIKRTGVKKIFGAQVCFNYNNN
jgi:hypothetical protein